MFQCKFCQNHITKEKTFTVCLVAIFSYNVIRFIYRTRAPFHLSLCCFYILSQNLLAEQHSGSLGQPACQPEEKLKQTFFIYFVHKHSGIHVYIYCGNLELDYLSPTTVSPCCPKMMKGRGEMWTTKMFFSFDT